MAEVAGFFPTDN